LYKYVSIPTVQYRSAMNTTFNYTFSIQSDPLADLVTEGCAMMKTMTGFHDLKKYINKIIIK